MLLNPSNLSLFLSTEIAQLQEEISKAFNSLMVLRQSESVSPEDYQNIQQEILNIASKFFNYFESFKQEIEKNLSLNTPYTNIDDNLFVEFMAIFTRDEKINKKNGIMELLIALLETSKFSDEEVRDALESLKKFAFLFLDDNFRGLSTSKMRENFKDRIERKIHIMNSFLRNYAIKNKDFIYGLTLVDEDKQITASLDEKHIIRLSTEFNQSFFYFDFYMHLHDYEQAIQTLSNAIGKTEANPELLSQKGILFLLSRFKNLIKAAKNSLGENNTSSILIFSKNKNLLFKQIIKLKAKLTKEQWKELQDVMNSYTENYFDYLQKHYSSSTVEFRPKTNEIVIRGLDLRDFWREHKINYQYIKKNASYVLTNIDELGYDKLALMFTEIEKQLNKEQENLNLTASAKEVQSDEIKVASINDQTSLFPESIEPKVTQDTSYSNQKQQKEIEKIHSLVSQSSSQQLGFSAKYNKYKIFPISYQNKVYFYGFFKISKKYADNLVYISKVELAAHEKIISDNAKIVSDIKKKGVVFVNLHSKASKKEKKKQKQLTEKFQTNMNNNNCNNNNNNNNNNAQSDTNSAVNKTLALGYSFKTKIPSSDWRILAELKDSVFKSGKRISLFKFCVPINHKDNIMQVVTTAFAPSMKNK